MHHELPLASCPSPAPQEPGPASGVTVTPGGAASAPGRGRWRPNHVGLLAILKRSASQCKACRSATMRAAEATSAGAAMAWANVAIGSKLAMATTITIAWAQEFAACSLHRPLCFKACKQPTMPHGHPELVLRVRIGHIRWSLGSRVGGVGGGPSPLLVGMTETRHANAQSGATYTATSGGSLLISAHQNTCISKQTT